MAKKMIPYRWNLSVANSAVAALLLIVAHADAARPPNEPVGGDVARVQPNLVSNGSFEDGADLPRWWRRHPGEPRGRNGQFRDRTIARTGTASGKLVWLDPISGPNKAGVQWNRYGLPVEGGSSVIVSGAAKTDGIKNTSAGIHMYDADGRHLKFTPIGIRKANEGWTGFRKTVVLPPQTTTIGLALYSQQGGTTWFDDVSVLGVPETAAARGTPAIDGQLDDACWAKAQVNTGFVLHQGDGLPKHETTVRIAYDDTHLYVAFDSRHAPGTVLKANAAERDGDVWLDDSVEVFLDPWHSHGDYYQFCVNSRGVVRDSHGNGVEWNSAANAAAATRKDGWTAELAIPFEDLALTLDSDRSWGINLVRNDRKVRRERRWSPYLART